MSVKKGDFVEIEYVGRLTDSKAIFDLTSGELAKKEGVFNPRVQYKPQIICLGEGRIVKGLDEFLIGKEEKKKYSVPLLPEQAFGKKDAKLLKIVPSNVFTKQNIKPAPGLRVNLDGTLGTIKTASGGRCVVDFNHPIAGRDVTYEVTIIRTVKKPEEKVESLLEGLSQEKMNITMKEKTCEITLDVPEQLQEIIGKEVTRLVKEITKVTFVSKKSNKTPQ